MPNTSNKAHFQRIFSLLGIASVLVYVGSVLFGLIYFRGEFRAQIIENTGALLTRFTQHQYQKEAPQLVIGLDLIDLALDASEMEGVVALRLFDPPESASYSIPGNLIEATISPGDLNSLLSGSPIIRYFAQFTPTDLFNDALPDDPHIPLVEVLVPVSETGGSVTAVIQYWLDGGEVRSAFARLDASLRTIGGLFLIAGGILYALLFVAARNRLVDMARSLAERNASLETANRELSLLARASAVGSVAGNLFHGLKNPLAGLKAYLRVTQQDAEAVALADRMEALVNETMDALRSQDQVGGYSLSLSEVRATAEQRLKPLGEAEGVDIRFSESGSCELPAHRVQLLLLVLRNLIDNALAVSAADQPIEVKFVAHDGHLQIKVSDNGPGIPDAVRNRLFQPGASAKQGGSGIGLAISAVIARQIPAELRLESSSASGSSFLVSIDL